MIVEGFIDFDYEITLLTVRALGADGDVETTSASRSATCRCSGDYVESWQPHADERRPRCERAQQIAQAVTDDLGGQGLFGVELFVKGDEVWFSEVSPRPHDTGMVTMITQWQNEFELHARAILGLPVDTSLQEPGRQRGDLRRRRRQGHRASTAWPRRCGCPARDLRLFGKPESFIKRRMGVALAHAADVDTARMLAKEAAAQREAAQGHVRPDMA